MSFYSIMLIWTSLIQFASSIPIFWPAKFLLKSQMIVLWEFPCTLYFAVLSLSLVWLFAIPWTIACQAPLSMGILQTKNTGVGSLSLLQGVFPTQGPNPGLLYAGRFFTSWATREASPLYNTSCFSLDDFINNILFLFLIFATIFIMCILGDPFVFVPSVLPDRDICFLG